MPPRRRIDPAAGRAALVQWHAEPAAADRATTATAVRYTLEELSLQAPGHSVEVRVPPFGAVQVIEGPRHKRGTPTNVVEMQADSWLRIATGAISWADAEGEGLVRASGQRADLSPYLPLLRLADDPA
ncbi:sterol carrier family protein [Luteipulveratus flavus]|uniref:Sterol carrier family protein n=1 Tax=Luteipulveratus flavus TaxID=3031728 RepID=A0ABT6C3W6_9MICO|nr:sterol carrier family protein [Luteipulveratus sp. YIM 133296]MDF8263659.1 sterol carrier family protein [Luteipulveratus sp. YIM 133296]